MNSSRYQSNIIKSKAVIMYILRAQERNSLALVYRLPAKGSAPSSKFPSQPSHSHGLPAMSNPEGHIAFFYRINQFLFLNHTLFNKPYLLIFHSFQQLRCRFILRILRDELSPNCKVQDGLSELLDVFGAGGEAWEVVEIEAGAVFKAKALIISIINLAIVQPMQCRRDKHVTPP